MLVEKLDGNDKKNEIIESWRTISQNKESFAIIEKALLCETSEWHKVIEKDGAILAIFDLRQVPLATPQYHKTMHIHFSPTLNLGVDDVGMTLEDLDRTIYKITIVMYHAFEQLLMEANNTNERLCKIYCECQQVLTLTREFAKYLSKKMPDEFECKLYGKWVEVKKK